LLAHLLRIKRIATTMSGVAHLAAKLLKTHFQVKSFGLSHAFEGFEVTSVVAQLLSFSEEGLHHLLAHSFAPHAGQKVHFFQFTNAWIAAHQWANAATAPDLVLRITQDQVSAAPLLVVLVHQIHFGIVDRKAIANCPVGGHYFANDCGHGRVVVYFDGSDQKSVALHNYGSGLQEKYGFCLKQSIFFGEFY